MAEGFAGVSADTSSYPKPAAPTSPLDIASKLGGLQSQKLDIDQKKLDQANQALGYFTRAVNSLGPDATKEQIIGIGKNMVNLGMTPASMVQEMNTQIPNDPSQMKAFLDRLRTQAQFHADAIKYHSNIATQDYGGGTKTYEAPLSLVGRNKPRTLYDIPSVEPPTTPVSREMRGPNGEVTGYQPGTAGVRPAPPIVRPGIAQPAIQGQVTSDNLPTHPGIGRNETIRNIKVEPPQSFDRRFGAAFPNSAQSQGLVTGPPAGEATAMESSAKHLAEDRLREANFQRDIYPLAQAIPGLEELGTKGTGPGTDTINHVKSFILSNVPGVKESDLASVKTFDETKKYLTDFVNQTGSSGTNDKLAAAFAGNPSVGISNAAAKDVAKSALALRRMQNAVNREFEAQNLPASNYSKWKAGAIAKTDPRAFGVDMMSDDAKAKLKAQLKKNPIEEKQFEDSLNLAVNMGYLTPPSKR